MEEIMLFMITIIVAPIIFMLIGMSHVDKLLDKHMDEALSDMRKGYDRILDELKEKT